VTQVKKLPEPTQDEDVMRIITVSPLRLSVADWDEVRKMVIRAWQNGYQCGLNREHVIHGGKPNHD